jgi:hypothetical protein
VLDQDHSLQIPLADRVVSRDAAWKEMEDPIVASQKRKCSKLVLVVSANLLMISESRRRSGSKMESRRFSTMRGSLPAKHMLAKIHRRLRQIKDGKFVHKVIGYDV